MTNHDSEYVTEWARAFGGGHVLPLTDLVPTSAGHRYYKKASTMCREDHMTSFFTHFPTKPLFILFK